MAKKFTFTLDEDEMTGLVSIALLGHEVLKMNLDSTVLSTDTKEDIKSQLWLLFEADKAAGSLAAQLKEQGWVSRNWVSSNPKRDPEIKITPTSGNKGDA